MKGSITNMIVYLLTSASRSNAFSFVPKKLNAMSQQKNYVSKAARTSTSFLRSSTSTTNGEKAKDSPYYITTPIYYVNDKPHIGHAYTSIACDVLARYKRLSNNPNVYFVSGTDEHGQKVENSANDKGISPQDFVDNVSVNFKDMLNDLCISNDLFIRTTDDYHKKAVQQFWNTLVEKGDIYLGAYEGWYSVRDECYYNESELIDGKAPTGAEVTWVTKEPSYFFKLSKYEDILLDYYDKNPDFIAPKSRKNEVVSFVKGGLRDLSISRTSFKWGVSVPNNDEHIMYVWIDALCNYLSAVGYASDDNKKDMIDTFWNDKNDSTIVHIVGKDILRFHAVYWPAFLIAAGLKVPDRLFAHGWWTKDGEKISKSLGNVIDPMELIEKYGVDQTRFFLMSEVTFGNDGDFSHESLVRKVNTNLSNEFGNLVQRTLTMVFKNCNKTIPKKPKTLTSLDEKLISNLKSLREQTDEAIEKQAISKYADIMKSIVWDLNKYMDDTAPWTLKKNGELDRMNDVLYIVVDAIRQVSILYQPLIPTSASKVLDLLCVPEDQRTLDSLDNSPFSSDDDNADDVGIVIAKPVAVFPRLELEVEVPV